MEERVFFFWGGGGNREEREDLRESKINKITILQK